MASSPMASGTPPSGGSRPEPESLKSVYRWIVRRILISVPVLLGITMCSFVFVRLAPGDPVRMMINPEYMAGGAEDYIARQRALLGLDQPLAGAQAAWLGELGGVE